MSLPFDQALAYANRVYLANRREFDAVILPPLPSGATTKTSKQHFNQWPGKVFAEPKRLWIHRGSQS